MQSIKIVNANLVNEGRVYQEDVLIKNGFIEKTGGDLSSVSADIVIDADGKFLIPGAIDDQVHFREPGFTHKADIYTESRAAVAGGITSFMEMPNTYPQAVTQEILEQKYQLAAQKSAANYSFYIGATNDNLEELLKTDGKNVCGIKIFMGSSTGNMLVDDLKTLENIFSKSNLLIATHCEDEATIRRNMAIYREKYGENVPIACHPLIRSAEACYLSSSSAVALAQKHHTNLHVLHISTAREVPLFDNSIPLEKKHITAEACIHHLFFDDRDYEKKGTHIKWNPAIKTAKDREAVFKAVLDDHIDVIATDHAPHTLEEKNNTYFKAPSGGFLVQHGLVAMLEFHLDGLISLEEIVQKMCHNPAIRYRINRRGFIREGYWADLVLVDLDNQWVVAKDNILYKCGWSPFEGNRFRSRVTHTIVSGHLVHENSKISDRFKGKRLEFDRI